VSFAVWKSDKFSERLYVRLIGLFLLVSAERIRKIHTGLVHDVLVNPSGHHHRRSRHPLFLRFQVHTFSQRAGNYPLTISKEPSQEVMPCAYL